MEGGGAPSRRQDSEGLGGVAPPDSRHLRRAQENFGQKRDATGGDHVRRVVRVHAGDAIASSTHAQVHRVAAADAGRGLARGAIHRPGDHPGGEGEATRAGQIEGAAATRHARQVREPLSVLRRPLHRSRRSFEVRQDDEAPSREAGFRLGRRLVRLEVGKHDGEQVPVRLDGSGGLLRNGPRHERRRRRRRHRARTERGGLRRVRGAVPRGEGRRRRRRIGGVPRAPRPGRIEATRRRGRRVIDRRNVVLRHAGDDPGRLARAEAPGIVTSNGLGRLRRRRREKSESPGDERRDPQAQGRGRGGPRRDGDRGRQRDVVAFEAADGVAGVGAEVAAGDCRRGVG